jgi:TonB family protein
MNPHFFNRLVVEQSMTHTSRQVEPLDAVLPPVAAGPGLQLLTELEPWPQVFRRNLTDLLLRQEPEPVPITSSPADFWPDVFVQRELPWRSFGQSALCHSLTVALVFAVTLAWQRRERPLTLPESAHETLTFVPVSEYLPPLHTGLTLPRRRKGEPEYARQPILSVPAEPDNRRQTIVTPPEIKLNHDVPLPNIVAWTETPAAPIAAGSNRALKLPTIPVIAPPPELGHSERSASGLSAAVIAPAPDVAAANSTRAVSGLQAAVVAPPPSVSAADDRRFGDISIGRSVPVAPAPSLPMDAQRSVQTRASLGGRGGGGDGGGIGKPQVVAPPPSAESAGAARGSGRLVALNLHPADIKGPIQPPAGNRRGEFAAGPSGKPGAPGTPDIPNGSDQGTNGGGGKGKSNGLPPGLSVGAGPPGAVTSAVAGKPSDATAPRNTVNPALLASAKPPQIASQPHKTAEPVDPVRATEVERRVFGGRKFYSMTSNLPNLNSIGGSWVIRYAELKQTTEKSDLTAPVPVRKIDPGYPLELMRQNVEGTVLLRAVIRSDGTVGDIEVMQSPDDRLDQFARTALSRWQFEPATKNGAPVDLQALVMIPFRVRKSGF